jgi:ATP-dependent DNA helicase 2 subunit 2
VIKHANVKKVDKKEKSRRERRKVQPASALDIDDLLNNSQFKRTEISVENAIPDFKALLDNAEREEEVKSIAEQMGSIIRKVVSGSVGDQSYQRTIEMLRVMRQELDDLEMPEVYNGFVEKFKVDLLGEKLGEGRNELWYLVRREKLGLLEDDNKINEERMRQVSLASLTLMIY